MFHLSGLLLCAAEEKILQKFFAIAEALLKAFHFNLMGWLGGGLELLPESLLRSDQRFAGSALNLFDSTSSLHNWRLLKIISLSILEFREGKIRSVGLRARISSRSAINSFVDLGSSGINTFLYPKGILCLDACSKISLKTILSLAQEVGRSHREKRSSDSERKPCQLASLKLVKERCVQGGTSSVR